jgi:hypothetical protein
VNPIRTRQQAKATAAKKNEKSLPRSVVVIERVKDVLDQLAIDTHRDVVFRKAILQELIAEATSRLENLS